MLEHSMDDFIDVIDSETTEARLECSTSFFIDVFIKDTRSQPMKPHEIFKEKTRASLQEMYIRDWELL